MKKMLLSILLSCFAYGCYAQEVHYPHFDVICEKSSFGYGEDEAAFFAIRNYVAFNQELPLESIEGILTQWYEEKPELRAYIAPGIASKRSFTDAFVVFVFAVSQLSDKDGPCFMDMITLRDRCQEVVRVLKKLGVEQTISEGQVRILGKQLAKELLED